MSKYRLFSVCRELNATITAESFLTNFKNKLTSFIRTRKMPFCDIIYFILGSSNKSVQAELDEFFDKKGCEGVSRQAFSKSRENIKPEAFIHLNDLLINKFEKEDGEIATYRGYRLFSADGTIIDLPNNEKLRSEFGVSTNGSDKSYAKGLAITAFDVLNKLTIFAHLYRYDDSEKFRIIDIVDGFANLYPKVIFLLDRGYPSFKLFSKLESNNQKFVIRVSSCALKEINIADKEDQIVTATQNNNTLSLRVVNISLDSGMVEKLVTNLDETFTISELKELYARRWGIETNYRYLKKKAIVEVFTGETVTAVMQDFHAAILVLNMAAIAEREQEDVLILGDKNKELKYTYHPNKSKIIADIKKNFISLLLAESPLHKLFLDILIYSRVKRYAYHSMPNRKFPRDFLHKDTHSKFTL